MYRTGDNPPCDLVRVLALPGQLSGWAPRAETWLSIWKDLQTRSDPCHVVTLGSDPAGLSSALWLSPCPAATCWASICGQSYGPMCQALLAVLSCWPQSGCHGQGPRPLWQGAVAQLGAHWVTYPGAPGTAAVCPGPGGIRCLGVGVGPASSVRIGGRRLKLKF